MPIILRVLFHALIIFCVMNLMTAVFTHHDVPILNLILSKISFAFFSVFSITAASTINRQKYFLIFFLAFVLICVAHKPMNEIMRAVYAEAAGMVMGIALGLMLKETFPIKEPKKRKTENE